eukprot:5862147-Pleurochrysis_carterae.AAC.1
MDEVIIKTKHALLTSLVRPNPCPVHAMIELLGRVVLELLQDEGLKLVQAVRPALRQLRVQRLVEAQVER